MWGTVIKLTHLVQTVIKIDPRGAKLIPLHHLVQYVMRARNKPKGVQDAGKTRYEIERQHDDCDEVDDVLEGYHDARERKFVHELETDHTVEVEEVSVQ